MKIERDKNETYLSFVQRATYALEDGLIDYKEWGRAVVGEDLYSEESTRRIAKFFNQFIQNLESDETINSEINKIDEINKAKEELKAERIKIQTANLEYNANARAEARSELFNEQIIQAISRLEPIKVKEIKVTPSVGKVGLLCLSDFHAGSEFVVKGLYDEVVNKFDFEIMKDRLWRLIGMIEADDIVVDELVVACLGDYLENILRISSLNKLREPVVETTIKFAEFLSTWLVELHNRLEVPITLISVGGNHDICRPLTTKITQPEENMGKIIVELIKLRLKDCQGIKVEDYTDFAVKTIKSTNIMFTHGEDKDLATTIEYFANLYNIDLDEIYAGHLHSFESKTIGMSDVGNRMIYRVGSICGLDPFSKQLRKAARPSAYFATYTDEGHGWSKDYILG